MTDIEAIKTYYGEVYDEVQIGGAYSIIGVPGQDYLDHVDALLAALDERDAEIARLMGVCERRYLAIRAVVDATGWLRLGEQYVEKEGSVPVTPEQWRELKAAALWNGITRDEPAAMDTEPPDAHLP